MNRRVFIVACIGFVAGTPALAQTGQQGELKKVAAPAGCDCQCPVVTRPQPGSTWRPGRWVRDSNGWHYVEGRWRNELPE